jgi:hypothetical protein
MVDKDKNQYSYESFIGKNSWIDYSAGGQFGIKLNNKLGLFTEVAVQKYWDRKIKKPIEEYPCYWHYLQQFF